MGKKLDLAGIQFGRLTAIEDVGANKQGARLWRCRCECGQESIVRSSDLVRGHIVSCGCSKIDHCHYLNESGLNVLNPYQTHGKSKTRLYRIWKDMKRRVTNPNRDNFKYYGGRGIDICDEWFNDFEPFYDWAVANGYSDNLEIDRIDNDGDYEPGNCHWVTKKVNCNNASTNRRIEYMGRTKTATEWAEFFNIPYTKLIYRLNAGWDLDRAFGVS